MEETDTHAASIAERAERTESEIARNDITGLPPAQWLAAVSRTIVAMSAVGLINYDADEFHDRLATLADTLGLPYLELYFAAEAMMHNPEIDRDNVVAWLAWCQQYAPERLVGKVVL